MHRNNNNGGSDYWHHLTTYMANHGTDDAERERVLDMLLLKRPSERATSGGSIITPRDATCLPLRLGHFSACCFCGDHHQLE